MRVSETAGLKYPDQAVTRFFFKHRLHEATGRVLELGCGNGSNLTLFAEYGWDVTGVDYSADAIEAADRNFARRSDANGSYSFLRHDLREGMPPLEGEFDCVLMPYSLYYIPREDMKRVLEGVNRVLAPGGSFFLAMRRVGDYRYGRGRRVEPNGYILDTPETGEEGALVVFYREHELVEMLEECLGVSRGSLAVLNFSFDNVQADRLISPNLDIVLWGRR